MQNKKFPFLVGLGVFMTIGAAHAEIETVKIAPESRFCIQASFESVTDKILDYSSYKNIDDQIEKTPLPYLRIPVRMADMVTSKPIGQASGDSSSEQKVIFMIRPMSLPKEAAHLYPAVVVRCEIEKGEGSWTQNCESISMKWKKESSQEKYKRESVHYAIEDYQSKVVLQEKECIDPATQKKGNLTLHYEVELGVKSQGVDAIIQYRVDQVMQARAVRFIQDALGTQVSSAQIVSKIKEDWPVDRFFRDYFTAFYNAWLKEVTR